MTVLVAYATTGGSTAEIARWIGEEIRGAGLPVDIRRAAEVHDIAGYTAIVLGGAIYAGGWHRDARQFAHRFAGQPTPPVWLFSSGPLDSSADETELPPIHHASEAMRALDARGHVTFGGRLSTETRGWLGFLARRLDRTGHTGDFRNPQRVRVWARGVAAKIVAIGSEPVADRTTERA